MKKGSFIILSILTILALIVWFSCNPMNHKNQKSFSLLDETDFVKATGGTPIGFAQGVTGGAGGTVIRPATKSEFQSALRLTGPVIIEISGTMQTGYPRCFADKTIIGISPGATLDGGLFLDERATNVIIQNLTINTNSGGDDGVTIRGGKNVWVDHCTFVDCNDGNVDVTEGADYVTVSWCKFTYTYDHGHNFVNLISSSDSDSGEFRVTFHHNWWSTYCVERMPSIRWGNVHVFNNYFNAPGNNYCVRTRIEAEVLVENNYFENTQNPWERYITSGTPGKIKVAGNTLVNCTFLPTSTDSDGNIREIPDGNDAVFTPSYSYTLESSSTVKASVMAGAGAE